MSVDCEFYYLFLILAENVEIKDGFVLIYFLIYEDDLKSETKY